MRGRWCGTASCPRRRAVGPSRRARRGGSGGLAQHERGLGDGACHRVKDARSVLRTHLIQVSTTDNTGAQNPLAHKGVPSNSRTWSRSSRSRTRAAERSLERRNGLDVWNVCADLRRGGLVGGAAAGLVRHLAPLRARANGHSHRTCGNAGHGPSVRLLHRLCIVQGPPSPRLGTPKRGDRYGDPERQRGQLTQPQALSAPTATSSLNPVPVAAPVPEPTSGGPTGTHSAGRGARPVASLRPCPCAPVGARIGG